MENLVGRKYGALTVVEFGYKTKDWKYYWKCKCECGNEKMARAEWLKKEPKGCCVKCSCQRRKPRKIISQNKFYFEDDRAVGTTTNGKKFYFDKEDYERVSAHTWGYDGKGYLRAVINGKHVSLHRFILNYNGECVIDHINNDPNDNRKCNLRVCSQADNIRNSKTPSNNTSGYKGVSRDRGRWRAYIRVNYKQIHLGNFRTKEEAARRYNEAALKYFGEFAELNEIPNVAARGR